MWPFITLSSYILVLYIDAQSIYIHIFAPNKQSHGAALHLVAHTMLSCDMFELYHAVPFNKITLQKQIDAFIHQSVSITQKSCIRLCIIFDDALIEQQLCFKKYMGIPPELLITFPHHLYDVTFMDFGNYEHDIVGFYIGKLRSMLFQWHLLAIALNMQLQRFLSNQETLMYAYRIIKHASFRQSQLTHEMVTHHGNLSAVLSADVLLRLTTINQEIIKQDLTYKTAVSISAALMEHYAFNGTTNS